MRDFHAFDHHVRDAFGWQIAYFLIQLVGFQLLGVFIGLFAQIGFMVSHSSASSEEASAFLKDINVQFTVTAIAYLIVCGMFFLFFGVRKKYGSLFASFKDYRNYLWGLLGGAGLLGFQILYSVLISFIFKAAGYEAPGVNANESSIRAMCQSLPVLCIIVFGVIGPFTEEIGYRVGLFGFTARFGKVLAYVLSAVIFGFIHFNWAALFTPELQATLPVEFANLPAYIIPGIGLAFLYDRFGLAASFTAHNVNNLYSIISTIIQGANGNA